MQFTTSHEIQDDELRFVKPAGHEQFHASLDAAKVIPTCISQECQWDLPSSPPRAVEKAILNQYLILFMRKNFTQLRINLDIEQASLYISFSVPDNWATIEISLHRVFFGCSIRNSGITHWQIKAVNAFLSKKGCQFCVCQWAALGCAWTENVLAPGTLRLITNVGLAAKANVRDCSNLSRSQSRYGNRF